MSEPTAEAERAPPRYVVLRAGTKLFDAPDTTTPRGVLADIETTEGWVMRVVDEDDRSVAVRADLDPGLQHCARPMSPFEGLPVTLWIRRSELSTVLTRTVELESRDCQRLVAQPGTMLTPLCRDESGEMRYQVGSCAAPRCAYPVPKTAIGRVYVAASADPEVDRDADVADGERAVRCLEWIDHTGARRPILRDERQPRARVMSELKPGQWPDCEELQGIACRGYSPRLGFDDVRYRVLAQTEITWADGSPIAKSEQPLWFRAVPHAHEGRLCWSAIEADDRSRDLVLCAPASSIVREQVAHVQVLQARDGDRSAPVLLERQISACYQRTLAEFPDLSGRIRVRYGADQAHAFVGVEPPGGDAFARCVAEVRREHNRDRSVQFTMDLHPPTETPAEAP